MLTHIWHTYRNSHTRPNSKYTSKSQSNTNTHNKIQQQTPILKTQLLCKQLQTTIDLDRTDDNLSQSVMKLEQYKKERRKKEHLTYIEWN